MLPGRLLPTLVVAALLAATPARAAADGVERSRRLDAVELSFTGALPFSPSELAAALSGRVAVAAGGAGGAVLRVAAFGDGTVAITIDGKARDVPLAGRRGIAAARIVALAVTDLWSGGQRAAPSGLATAHRGAASITAPGAVPGGAPGTAPVTTPGSAQGLAATSPGSGSGPGSGWASSLRLDLGLTVGGRGGKGTIPSEPVYSIDATAARRWLLVAAAASTAEQCDEPRECAVTRVGRVSIGARWRFAELTVGPFAAWLDAEDQSTVVFGVGSALRVRAPLWRGLHLTAGAGLDRYPDPVYLTVAGATGDIISVQTPDHWGYWAGAGLAWRLGGAR